MLQQELAVNKLQRFDVFAVDAFSGDPIPVHLLTREAMALYLHHLRGPFSVVASHVTNRSVDLHPVVAALAREYHLASLEIHPPEVGDWILLCADPSMLAMPMLKASGYPIEFVRPELLSTNTYSTLSRCFGRESGVGVSPATWPYSKVYWLLRSCGPASSGSISDLSVARMLSFRACDRA